MSALGTTAGWGFRAGPPGGGGWLPGILTGPADGLPGGAGGAVGEGACGVTGAPGRRSCPQVPQKVADLERADPQRGQVICVGGGSFSVIDIREYASRAIRGTGTVVRARQRAARVARGRGSGRTAAG